MSKATQNYANSLPDTLESLYGARTRAASSDIAREVLRLNDAVKELAHRYLDPLGPIISFEDALRLAQDSSNVQEKSS